MKCCEYAHHYYVFSGLLHFGFLCKFIVRIEIFSSGIFTFGIVLFGKCSWCLSPVKEKGEKSFMVSAPEVKNGFLVKKGFLLTFFDSKDQNNYYSLLIVGAAFQWPVL